MDIIRLNAKVVLTMKKLSALSLSTASFVISVYKRLFWLSVSVTVILWTLPFTLWRKLLWSGIARNKAVLKREKFHPASPSRSSKNLRGKVCKNSAHSGSGYESDIDDSLLPPQGDEKCTPPFAPVESGEQTKEDLKIADGLAESVNLAGEIFAKGQVGVAPTFRTKASLQHGNKTSQERESHVIYNRKSQSYLSTAQLLERRRKLFLRSLIRGEDDKLLDDVCPTNPSQTRRTFQPDIKIERDNAALDSSETPVENSDVPASVDETLEQNPSQPKHLAVEKEIQTCQQGEKENPVLESEIYATRKACFESGRSLDAIDGNLTDNSIPVEDIVRAQLFAYKPSPEIEDLKDTEETVEHDCKTYKWEDSIYIDESAESENNEDPGTQTKGFVISDTMVEDNLAKSEDLPFVGAEETLALQSHVLKDSAQVIPVQEEEGSPNESQIHNIRDNDFINNNIHASENSAELCLSPEGETQPLDGRVHEVMGLHSEETATDDQRALKNEHIPDVCRQVSSDLSFPAGNPNSKPCRQDYAETSYDEVKQEEHAPEEVLQEESQSKRNCAAEADIQQKILEGVRGSSCISESNISPTGEPRKTSSIRKPGKKKKIKYGARK